MIELSELENSGYPEGGEMRAAPRFVEIRVTDTGRGVPEEIRRQIFAPFFSTSRGKSGIGHGLAVCRGLVQEMGGRIFLERGDPGSTVFTVRLPFIPCVRNRMTECGKLFPVIHTARFFSGMIPLLSAGIFVLR